jgi:membrane fusion protein, multidrug efflux system
MVEMPRTEQFRQAVEAAEAAKPTSAARSRLGKRAILALALLAGAAAAAHYGQDYWRVGRFLVSTDDAYVKADYTTVAPKISGYLAEVLVRDNQAVKAGDVLARIDDRDVRTALDRAQAEATSAEAAVRNLDAQIDLQDAEIAQAQAAVSATQASLSFASSDAQRYHELLRTGSGTAQRAEQTQASRDQLSAQLLRDNAAVMAAERKTAVLRTARDQAAAQAEAAHAAAHQAELNLGYATISAAIDGTVGARTLRVGQFVAAGTPLMAVVPLQSAYVVANFKETQLAEVRAGQPVEVEVDSLPGVKLKAHVDSIAPASGLEFALLPPDNATGNFTKIVQRIPVRIAIDDLRANLLRSGMSVEPVIDTRRAAE